MPSEEEEIAKLQAERKAATANKDKYAGYDTVLADEEPEEDDEPPVRCVTSFPSPSFPHPPSGTPTPTLPVNRTPLAHDLPQIARRRGKGGRKTREDGERKPASGG